MHVCGATGFDARFSWTNSTQITGQTNVTYTSGSIVTMRAFVSYLNHFYKVKYFNIISQHTFQFLFAHGGYLRIKLCKLNSSSDIVTQDCLDQNVLKIKTIDYPANWKGETPTNYDDGTIILTYLHNTNLTGGDSLSAYANFRQIFLNLIYLIYLIHIFKVIYYNVFYT